MSKIKYGFTPTHQKEECSMPEGFTASTTTVDEAFDRLERKLEAYYGKSCFITHNSLKSVSRKIY